MHPKPPLFAVHSISLSGDSDPWYGHAVSLADGQSAFITSQADVVRFAGAPTAPAAPAAAALPPTVDGVS